MHEEAVHSRYQPAKYTAGFAQQRFALSPLFCSHSPVGNVIISSLASGAFTKRVVFPVGPHLSHTSRLALVFSLAWLRRVPRCRAFKFCNGRSSFDTRAPGEIIRRYVRTRGLRHQRGHYDPLCDGGGAESQRHRGADDAAQRSGHGGEGHLLRRA